MRRLLPKELPVDIHQESVVVEKARPGGIIRCMILSAVGPEVTNTCSASAVYDLVERNHLLQDKVNSNCICHRSLGVTILRRTYAPSSRVQDLLCFSHTLYRHQKKIRARAFSATAAWESRASPPVGTFFLPAAGVSTPLFLAAFTRHQSWSSMRKRHVSSATRRRGGEVWSHFVAALGLLFNRSVNPWMPSTELSTF